MSFSEKSAWIFLVSIVLVFGLYFLHVPLTLDPSPNPRLVRGLFYSIAALVVIEVIAHLVVFIRAEDPPASKDERERLIDYKAIRLSYYVYVVGSVLAVSTIHFGANAIALSYGVLLAFLIGEVAKNITRIVLHRRGV